MKNIPRNGKVFFGLIGLALVSLLVYIALSIWLQPKIIAADKANASWAELENPKGVVSLYKDILLDETLTVNQRFSEIAKLVDVSHEYDTDENKSYQLYWLVMSGAVAEHEASGAMAGLLSFRETFENRLIYLAAVMRFCHVDIPTVYLDDQEQFELILKGELSYKDMMVSINWFVPFSYQLSVVMIFVPLGMLVYLSLKGFFDKKEENQ